MKATIPDHCRPPWALPSAALIKRPAGSPTSDSRSISNCGERAHTETVYSPDTASWTWTRRTERELSPDAKERSNVDIGQPFEQSGPFIVGHVEVQTRGESLGAIMARCCLRGG